MKRTIVCILAVLFIQSGIALAQNNENTWLKPGAQLNYAVNYNGPAYDFVITNLKIGETVSFDWRMTEPANMKGSVNISKDALDTASAQMNNFESGPSNLTDKTTVWMCKNVYKAIKAEKSVTIDAGEGKTLLAFKKAEIYTTLIDGKETKLNALYAETSKRYKYWILDDPKNPIILKMDLGWSIELRIATTK
jgi:hypothetical protein